MSKPKLLDLFCGAGGASKGYADAGFDVVGVDIKPQPRYPFAFVQAEAAGFLSDLIRGIGNWDGEDNRTFRYVLSDFAAIHASPPCQAFSNATVIHGKPHKDFLTPTRNLLQQCGIPWVIENVPGAPMRCDVMLCGSMFGERRLIRHRLFEFNEPTFAFVPPCDHSRNTVSVFGHGGHIYHGVAEWREVMGIDWMNRGELAQAIPPAYTRWIGSRLMEAASKAGG